MKKNHFSLLQRKCLERFPKVRNILPPEYSLFHEEFYKAAREGKHTGATIALKLEKWMHRKVAAEPARFPFLEIGAGTLNHIQYEGLSGEYDIVEPMQSLYEGKSEIHRISNIYSDIGELSFEHKYERIGSVAVLEHVLDLPALIARSALLLEVGGVFRAGIPSEGGALWRLAYKYGTGTTFRLKYKLDYEIFQKYEHVNTAREIIDVIEIFFDKTSVHHWPLDIMDLSFYTYISAQEPRIDVAKAYLQEMEI